MPIRHVLFDADGVLQIIPGGWNAAMEPHLGDRTEEFFRRTWSEEMPTLAGGGDYLPLLAAALRDYGVTTPAEEVYADVWHRIEVIEDSLAIVHAARAAGYGVHLGTNQESYRAAYMRETLGYDDVFDVSCYSCELGVAKPNPDFFVRAARLIGDDPASILFIDDNEPNVDAARVAGLAAVHWHVEQGHDVLTEQLAQHGVVVTPPASDDRDDDDAQPATTSGA